MEGGIRIGIGIGIGKLFYANLSGLRRAMRPSRAREGSVLHGSRSCLGNLNISNCAKWERFGVIPRYRVLKDSCL